jgi:hypothetical protein
MTYAKRLKEFLSLNGLTGDVSVGVVGDSSTVRMLGVSPADVQKALVLFDWSHAAQQAWEEDQQPARRNLHRAATNAIDKNKDYLDITNPTIAQMRQQLDNITKQNNAIIERVIQLE